MKYSLSKRTLVLILISFIGYRLVYFENNPKNGYNATSWDALGYYMYLPGLFIYHDVKELKWIGRIDSTYHVTGGTLYQVTKLKSGTYTGKYLSGVAIIESPFFFIGHFTAYMVQEPQDGFSWPYQYAIMFGAIFWSWIGFVFLRKVLLKYFDEKVTSLTLILIVLASNLIQYVSIDGAMSHSFIFTLYAILIWLTIRWHEKATVVTALGIGIVCGMAVICRPTELIMVFIPLLWNTHSKEAKSVKWKMVQENIPHVLICILGGIIAVMPQLLYWKYTTGSFVYDTGSKWFFLNPWFRVLVGPEKGWFLYTPVAILMVLGFFFMRNQPFRKAVLVFCLLNIWIIISWSEWKYGASYSTRALVQSYPVFALSLACTVQWFYLKKREVIFYVLSVLLIALNFYQLTIYNWGIMESFSPLISWV
ncbi:MAG: hypothetical protein ACJ75J_14015 [Cytophagaceae bacterium]